MELILQNFGPADMIAVRVRDDHVFDLRRIETQLFQAADNLFLGVVREERIENNDSLAAGERPGIVDFRADEVEIIEDLGWLDVPRVTGRWGAGRRVP